MSKSVVYFVPYLDGDWLGYGPLDPDIGYGLLPANRREINANLKIATSFWKSRTGGKVVFGAHSGTYCREVFYEEPAFGYYRELVDNGGEIAVHPHEERINAGHFIEDLDHMRYIISWKRQELLDAGIKPTALRLPYNGFVSGLTRIAQENDLLVDLSAAPGFKRELWRANWEGAPSSAWFLNYDDHTSAEANGEQASPVLEIPLGWDGEVPEVGHYLFNEQIEFDRLAAIWNAIVRRAETGGQQMVYFLCHLHAMPDRELSDRISRFLDYAQSHSGIPVTPTEAYRIHSSVARH